MRPSSLTPPPMIKPERRVHDVQVVAAPVMGLDTVTDLASMDPTSAVELDNFISSNGGLAVREGWFEYATGIDHNTEIRTIFSHNEAAPNATLSPLNESELFAATDGGIFMIEGGGDLSTLLPVITLSGDASAGRLSVVSFVNDGAHFTIACSETDGGFIYDGATWTKMTSVGGPGPGVITGVDPATFVQVCVYKKRLMFVTRSSSVAWILDVGAVGGVAKKFDFGPNLQNGGSLLALVNWTQDAGAGIDDRLVVIGSAGDLAIYQGNDPTSATDFANVGIWYIGQPPLGRRCFTSSGGNVYILTQYGLIPVSQIVQGGLDNVLTSSTDMLRQLRKMQQRFTEDFSKWLDVDGWEVMNIPAKAMMHITRPRDLDSDYTQYAFQMQDLSWSRMRDIPAVTFAVRLSEVYAGTKDGRVLRIYSGYSDGEKIDGTGAQYIRSRVTPAFNYFGSPMLRKQCVMLMPMILAAGQPTYVVRVNVDFNISEEILTPIAVQNIDSLWDQARWDQARWAPTFSGHGEWRSVNMDLGYALAPTFFFSSNSKTVLASISYMLKAGGVL